MINNNQCKECICNKCDFNGDDCDHCDKCSAGRLKEVVKECNYP